MSLASVLVHHLAGIAKKAGYNFNGDCAAETTAEVEALEDRIADLEDRALSAKGQIDSHDAEFAHRIAKLEERCEALEVEEEE